MTAAAPRLFCFGLGYSALALAGTLAGRGWRIAGTCRSMEKQRALAARGVEAHLFDRDRPLADAPAALAGTTHLLSSVPPDASGDPVIDLHGDDIGALKGLAWAGYLSTTGVYGDHAGGWVDEDTPRTPAGERGRRRVAAEDAWLGLRRRFGTPVHLFRLAGIYGPGRNALESVKAGAARRVVKPGQVFSRIHRDDIVQALIASMDAPDPGSAYNLCDDEAAPPQDVIAYACVLLGREPPPEIPFSAAELSPMARSFYEDNKRVRNRRMKQALGVSLKWPTYREGLKGLL
ncbi:MAG: SDR family oxidoreductase [Alphaproteobacteria bacterium]